MLCDRLEGRTSLLGILMVDRLLLRPWYILRRARVDTLWDV